MKINREFKIGLMIIVGITFLVFGVNYLKGVNIFTPSTYFYAKYKNIDGLMTSAPVRINGHTIGTVHEITYDFSQETPFVVVVSLDDDIQIPEGSILELSDDGLLGGKCMRIILNRETDKMLNPGDTIYSRVAGGMFDGLEEKLMPQISDQLLPHVDSLLIACKILIENKSLENSLKSLEVITKNLEVSSAKLNTMMSNDFPHIISNVDTITSNFATTSQNLSAIDFANTMNEIDATIKNLHEITAKLQSTDGTAGLLLNDKELYTNLNSTVESAEALLTDIKQNPSRYINVSVFGKSKDNNKDTSKRK